MKMLTNLTLDDGGSFASATTSGRAFIGKLQISNTRASIEGGKLLSKRKPERDSIPGD